MEPKTALSYHKRSGTSGIGGQLYEIKLSMYVLLECLISKSQKRITGFFLATNVKEADNFDDVVVKYFYKEDGVEKSKVCFIQAKHREKKYKNPVSVKLLLSDSEKEDFNLRKYLKSFKIIHDNFQSNESELQNAKDPIFSSNIDDAEFIIYTNNSSKFEKNKTMDNLIGKLIPNSYLNLSTSIDHIYNIKYDNQNFNILKYPMDFFVLLNSLVKLIQSNKPEIDGNSFIFRQYYTYLNDYVIEKNDNGEVQFKENFINGSDDNPVEINNLREKIIEKCTTKKIKPENILQMLKNKKIHISTTFLTNLASGEHKKRMDPEFDVNMIEYFLGKLKLYCDQFDEVQLESEIKAKIKAHYLGDVNTIYNDVYDRMQNWWKDENVNTYLTENNNWFLEANRNSALNILYLSAKKEFQDLTARNIKYNTDVINQMENVINEHKCINIVVKQSTKLLNRLKIFQTLNGMNKFNMEDIKSMKYFFCDLNSLGDQVVMAFQGQVNHLVVDVQNYTNYEEFIEKLYQILQNKSEKRLILITSNNLIPEMITSDEKYLIVNDNEVSFNHLDSKTKNQILNEKNIIFQGNEITMMKVIREELTKYIDEELTFILIEGSKNIEIGSKLNGLGDVKEHFVDRSFKPIFELKKLYSSDGYNEIIVIVAGPGMGKTTFLNSVEEISLNTENFMWRVRIDLSQHQAALRKLKTGGNINEASIINFLMNILKLENELDCEVFKSFFHQQKLFIMLDGYDEVIPHYKDQVIALLKILRNSNIRKVIITTRIYAAPDLIKEIECYEFKLQPFSKIDQKSFLEKVWKSYLQKWINPEELVFLNNILEMISVNQFMETPLHLKIITDYCEHLFKRYSKENKINEIDLKLFENINLFTMYEHIIKMKYVNIFCEEKRKIDLNIGSNMDSVDEEYARFKEEHKRMALYALFGMKVFKSLYSEREVTDLEKTIKYINEGKIKAGVVNEVIENLPIFVHRTYAEFFVAILIRDMCQENRQEEVFKFFETTQFTFNRNEMIRKFFDLSFIDERHSIHNAIINNLKNIEEIIGKSKNPIELINNPDNGGRTPMHLAASYDSSNYIACVLLSYFSVYKTTDDVFKWQPISYAMFYQNLTICDFLYALEKNSNFILEAMKSKTNYHYTNFNNMRMLMIAAVNDSVDVAKFIFQENPHILNRINERYECSFNYTLLHFAVKSNSLNFVDFLMENGALLTVKNGLGDTPIDYAMRYSNKEMKKKIMQRVDTLGIKYTSDHIKNWNLIINDWSSSSFRMQRLIEVIRNNRFRFTLAKLRKDAQIIKMANLKTKNILTNQFIEALEILRNKVDYNSFPSHRHCLQDVSSHLNDKLVLFDKLIDEVKEKHKGVLAKMTISDEDYSDMVEEVDVKIQKYLETIQLIANSIKWEDEKENLLQQEMANSQIEQ